MAKFYKYLLLTLAFTGVTKVDARIEVKSYTKDGKFSLFSNPEFSEKIPEQYSLFWGSAFASCKFIYNLRFFGNFRVEKDERSGRDVHTGEDGVEALLIQLFPDHTSGKLVAKKEHEKKDKESTIQKLAALLIKTELAREILKLKGNETYEEFKKLLDLQKRTKEVNLSSFSDNVRTSLNKFSIQNFFKDKSTLRGAAKDKSNLISGLNSKCLGVDENKLMDAINDESKYGYPDLTVERIVLAYISEILNSQEEATLFYEIYSEYRNLIFSKSHNDAAVANLKGNDAASNIYSLVMETVVGPYNNPVSNGKCPAWKKDGSEIKAVGKDFQDCVETSIRHLFNFVADQDRIPSEDNTSNDLVFGDLRERVLIEFQNGTLGTDRINELEDFYTKTGKEGLNSGMFNVRGDWNKVVFGFDGNVNEVRYNKKNESVSVGGGNDLKSGIDNVVRVMCSVLGIKYDALKEVCPRDPKEFTEACFYKFLKILNPDNDYSISFYPDKCTDYGKIQITIKGKDCYSLDLVYSEHHGYADTQTLAGSVALYENVDDKQKTLLGFISPDPDSNRSAKSNPYYRVFVGARPNAKSAFDMGMDAGDSDQRDAFRTIANKILDLYDDEIYCDKNVDISWCSSLRSLSVDIWRKPPLDAELKLPTSIEDLTIGCKYDLSLLNLGAMKNLRKLHLSEECTGYGTIPQSVQTLETRDNNFSALAFPESIESLTISCPDGTQSLDLTRFTEVEYLTISLERTGSPLRDIIVPEKVKELTIMGGKVEGKFVLPESIMEINIFEGVSFYDEVVLPPNVRSLLIGNSCEFHKLNFDKAEKLTDFGIGEDCHFYDEVVLPPNIRSFIIGQDIYFHESILQGSHFHKSLVLPECLESLLIGKGCNFHKLNFDKAEKLTDFEIERNCDFYDEVVLPPNIRSLLIRNGCNFHKLNFDKAEKLTDFEIGENCQFYDEVVLPPNIRSFIIGQNSHFHESLVLPECLESLDMNGCRFHKLNFDKAEKLTDFEIGDNCIFCDEVVLPPNVRYLTIGLGSNFEKSLVFPECLETLYIKDNSRFYELNFDKATKLNSLIVGPNCEVGRDFSIPNSVKTLMIGQCKIEGKLTPAREFGF
jgi:hypothetical protein